tara:strand:- start:440 stop:1549 length:1110 start_codon:yes stop_codon:yes gene_type:complete
VNKKVLIFLFLVSLSAKNIKKNKSIIFPNLPGFKTLICDFHTHTVFSNGSVWPDIRVQEAIKDGLDAIAITENINYDSRVNHYNDFDRNQPYELAKTFVDKSTLLIINGSDLNSSPITDQANAIFLKDANKLINSKKPIEDYIEAKKQGAFTFWTQPYIMKNLSNDGDILNQVKIEMIKSNLVHGIEIVNDTTFSNKAFQVALDYDLTLLGTSDIHGIIDWQYQIESGRHRPVTLVFAREKSQSSLKKALKNGQTVIWYDKNLIGKNENLLPLISSSLKVKSAKYKIDEKIINIVITNNSDANYILRNQSNFDFYNSTNLISIPPHGYTVIDVIVMKKRRKINLEFEVLNCLIAPNTHPVFRLVVKPKF